MSKFKLWLSRKLLDMIRPALDRDIDLLVDAALNERRHLGKDIRAFILDDLNERIPRESTTHSLACHVRDHARQLEDRIARLEQSVSTDHVAVPIEEFQTLMKRVNDKRR